MPMYQLAWNATLKKAVIQADGAALPGGGGYVDAGSYEYVTTGKDEHVEAHYHKIQDLLYKRGFTAMQEVKINAQAVSVDVQPPTLALKVGQKMRLSAKVLPAMSPQNGVWASGTPATCTVDANGVVTAVAAGTSNVTFTQGALTDTCAVTVTA